MVNPASLAARCLLKANLTELPADPRLMLCFCRGTYLYTFEQALRAKADPAKLSVLGESLPAATFVDPKSEAPRLRAVVYLPNTDPVRLRFSLAHELGHIALKHRGFETPGERISPQQEKAADDFARWLLMPPALVRALQREQGALWAEQLAAVFGVALREALRAEHLPPPDPETDAPLCDLLLKPALARIPARMPASWHPLSIRFPE